MIRQIRSLVARGLRRAADALTRADRVEPPLVVVAVEDAPFEPGPETRAAKEWAARVGLERALRGSAPAPRGQA